MKRLTVLTRIIITALLSIILFNASIWAATSTVTTGTTHQTIRGFGASNAWSDCGSCLPGSAKNAWFTAARLDELFTTTGNGIGLSIIRMRIPPDAGQNGAAIAPVQGAVARGAIVMASEWTPPTAWKTVNQNGNSPPSELQAQYYDEYANYLRDFVNSMRNTYGVTIDTLSPANEPDWRVTYDGCDWTGNQIRDFMKNNLGPTFAAAGLTTKLTVGESYANAFSITDPTLNDVAARDYTDIISVHTYGGGPSAYPLAATHNKEYWMTERASFDTYDGTMTNGLTVAGWLHNGMVTAEYNAWLYWWLASDAANEGLTSETQGTPKRFYIMGNYSKFVRPGFVRIEASAPGGGVNCSAYRNTGSTSFVFIATNTNASTQSMTFNIPGIGLTSVTPYVTSPSLNLAAQAAVTVSGNAFTFTLPAQSVVSFVGNMPAGSPTRTPTNTPYAGTPTFTATPTNTPNSILLDDMEDGNNTNNWGGDWYSYSGTGTTITPKPFVMTAGGMTGSANYRASIIATVADYAGMGTNLNAAQTGVDLTSYIAVEFWVRGNGGNYWFHFTQADITSGDYYGVAFVAPATWTKVTVPIDQASLGKRGFGSETGPFAENAVVALQWTSNGNGALDIQVDNVAFLTSVVMTPTRTPSRTPTVSVPTPTYTRTRTNTPVNTATYTYTRTNTPLNTITYTQTRTITPANTATFTYTRTNTPVNTFTFTSTVTNSQVNTATLTRTNSPSPSMTPSFTASATASVSPQNTFTNTPTRTLTYTPTFTATWTSTILPSATYTRTRTNTPVNTATNTATFTRTGSPTMTMTASFTRTLTLTPNYSPTFTPTGIQPTSTITPTHTRTLTPANTLTYTNTALPTSTNTAVNTSTRTATSTPGNTASNTPVNTATVTSSFTASATASVSPQISYTMTLTRTTLPATLTFTPTLTLTNTVTFTRTATPSRTQTLTRTGTPTRTESPDYSPTETYTGTPPTSTNTPSITRTETEIPTDTELPTGTVTPVNTNTRTSTVTSTRTVTPVNTLSFTASVTPTLTLTLTSNLTFTYTSTQVSSLSNTPTRTRTATVTNTNTPVNTVTRTGTPTLTLTLTHTYTFTRTSTPVNTPTMTWTLTSVATPTATIAWESTFKIENVIPHPNPYKTGAGNLNIKITITKQASDLKVRVYTASFRRVLELDAGSANTREFVITIPQYKLSRLSLGTYYILVTGKSGNESAVSKPSYLILIK